MHPVIEKALAEGGGVDVRPLAKAAGVSPASLYRAIHRGEIAVTQIGKRLTVPAHVARQLLHLPDPAATKPEAA